MKAILAVLIMTGPLTAHADEIPTVTLCELARDPKLHFDKVVRLTAVFEQWTEGQYFTDEHCPLSHDDQIGARLISPDHAFFDRLHSPEYASRAIVTVVGMLKNETARHFYWYGSLFEVSRIESERPAVQLYGGDLQEGRDYRAEGVYRVGGDFVLTLPLRLPAHHAGRVEWAGLHEAEMIRYFDESKRKEPWKGTIVFRVMSKAIVPMGRDRWNTTVTCKVLRVE